MPAKTELEIEMRIIKVIARFVKNSPSRKWDPPRPSRTPLLCL